MTEVRPIKGPWVVKRHQEAWGRFDITNFLEQAGPRQGAGRDAELTDIEQSTKRLIQLAPELFELAEECALTGGCCCDEELSCLHCRFGKRIRWILDPAALNVPLSAVGKEIFTVAWLVGSRRRTAGR